jgi:hypothetical protein
MARLPASCLRRFARAVNWHVVPCEGAALALPEYLNKEIVRSRLLPRYGRERR